MDETAVTMSLYIYTEHPMYEDITARTLGWNPSQWSQVLNDLLLTATKDGKTGPFSTSLLLQPSL